MGIVIEDRAARLDKTSAMLDQALANVEAANANLQAAKATMKDMDRRIRRFGVLCALSSSVVTAATILIVQRFG